LSSGRAPAAASVADRVADERLRFDRKRLPKHENAVVFHFALSLPAFTRTCYGREADGGAEVGDSSLSERIAAWLWRLWASDPELTLIFAAARGQQVDPDQLAEAYWRQYFATYRPRDEWQAMSRGRRNAVYRTRLRLIGAYAAFPEPHRQHVAARKPARPVR
jgi:hypothetical protein